MAHSSEERASHLLSDQDGMSTPDKDSLLEKQPRKKRHKKHRKRNAVDPAGSNQIPEEIQEDNNKSNDSQIPSKHEQKSRVFGTGDGKLASVDFKTTTWVPDPMPNEHIDGNITITASYPSFADLNSSGQCSYLKAHSTTTTSLNSSPLHQKKKIYADGYHLRSRSAAYGSQQKSEESNEKGVENWWKIYNTSMVKYYPQCLLVLATPTSDSVLIDYFLKLYNRAEESIATENIKNCLSDVKLSLVHIAECLDEGADIDYTDSFGQTILMEAVRSWHIDVISYLLDNDADMNLYDRAGRACLHIAAAADRPDVVALLCDKGASINARTKISGETALHLAARRCALLALEMLVIKGANIEICDYRGRTPLYLAAEYDRQTAVSILLNAGAKVNITDRDGTSLFVQLALTSSVHIDLALNKLIHTDTMVGKGLVNAEILEICPKDWYEDVQTNCLLDIIESGENGNAVRHAVIKSVIEKRWKKFGRTLTIVNFFFRFLFFLVWTLWILIIRWEEKAQYQWPEDTWRIVIPLVGLIALVMELRIETSEIFYSIRRGVWMARSILARLTDDKQHLVHPRWPDEYDQLQELSAETERKTFWWHQTYQYHKDLWNIYDLIVFILLIACIVTHTVDVLDHTMGRSRLHGQLGSVVTLLLGIRLMKETRGFVLTGELVIMLGLMAADFWRFIFLYLQLYIPFTIAFWVIFGGERYPHTSRICMFNCTDSAGNASLSMRTVKGWVSDFDICLSNCSFISVTGMETYAKLCFSLFRLTLVDEYDLETMKSVDPILSYVLVTAFLLTSAVVGINFLIGLISNALSDGAKQYVETHTILQKVRVINMIEQTYYLCSPRPDKCREQLVREARKSPLEVQTEIVTSQTTKETIMEMRQDMSRIAKLIKSIEQVQQEQTDILKAHRGCLNHRPDDTPACDFLRNNNHTQTVTERRKWFVNASEEGKLGSFESEGQDFITLQLNHHEQEKKSSSD